MNQEYNNEDYINRLVDEYKSKGTEALKLELLKAFEPYFDKYVYMLCTSKPVDLNNKDTITFLRLFMNDEDRSDASKLSIAGKRTITYLRSLFGDCTEDDIYDEMVCLFLEQLNRYKPMITDHKTVKERISFTHFLQVNTRYKMKNIATERARDALRSMHNLEYNDELNSSGESGYNFTWHTIDFSWVRGFTTGDLFGELEEYERYLLFLKYENGESKPLSDYDLARLTGTDRMYIRRKMLRIKEKLKALVN